MIASYEKMLNLLRQSGNPAADQTLGYALLSADSNMIPELASVLLARGSDDAVGYVIQVYHKVDPSIRQTLVNRCPGISGALRMLCRHPDLTVRKNVIDLIAASSHSRLCYVLALLLNDELPALRKKAAETFKKISLSLRDRLRADVRDKETAGGSVATISLADDLNQYFLALEMVLDTFASHLRTEVVESAMMFAPWLTTSLWNKFTGERSKIGRVATEILARESNLNYAAFAFRALTCPDLGRVIAPLIASECNPGFIRQWLGYSKYRLDQHVQKNLARIREFRWLSGDLKPLMEMPPDLQNKFIDVLMLTGITPQTKLDILETLMVAHDPSVQEHVVSTLIESNLPDIAKLLQRAVAFENAIPYSAKAAQMASRHLERMKKEADGKAILEPMGDEKTTGVEGKENKKYFERFWQSFEQLDGATCHDAIDRLRLLDLQFEEHLNEKLNSSDPADRTRALKMVRQCESIQNYAEAIYRLCRDEDVVVRSSAVSTLAGLPGKKTEQVLIESLDDENLRVQANAIEVLEALDPPDLSSLMEEKVRSSNNRIRANAIKAILKPQYVLAIRALSSMLDHPDPTFRRSALWVVSQTTPLRLAKKVYDLAKEDSDPEVKLAAQKAVGDLLQCWKSGKGKPEDAVAAGAEK